MSDHCTIFFLFRSASAPLSALGCTLMPGEGVNARAYLNQATKTSEDTAMADKAQTWVYTED